MAYSVRLYKNTGFNTSNIPDSPALLNQCQYIDASSGIEWMQDRFLSSISVQVAGYSYVENVDYLRVNDFYYFVVGIHMTSTDVANFSLKPDFVTSAGGVNGFKILDGVTTRVHISNDGYGKADSNDPMLAPFEPLQIRTVWKKPTTGGTTFLESTVDLEDTQQAKESIGYEDSVSGQTVCVPAIKPPSMVTAFAHTNGVTERHGTKVYSPCSDSGVTAAQKQVSKNISYLRSLGVEQAIVNQVRIPNAYISATPSGAVKSKMTGKSGVWGVPELPFNVFNLPNKLVDYSAFLKYGLISCSGESCEFEPQDLHLEGDGLSAPSVTYVSDPHLDGKPYFRFQRVNGDNTAGGFWRNCISGMQWKQVPLVFQGASGTALNQLRFENTRDIAERRIGIQKQNTVNEITRAAGATGLSNYVGDQNTILGQIKAGLASGLDTIGIGANFITSPLNGGQNMLQAMSAADDQEKMMNFDYGAELRNQLLDIAINANVYTPTVNFPFNSHIVQDQMENGVLVYRYLYTPTDAARINRLLTMYGYKFSKALDNSDFTNRRYFNFVECANITVGGKARWWNDGIAAQLTGGVRIWHVLPDPGYYGNNPVR